MALGAVVCNQAGARGILSEIKSRKEAQKVAKKQAGRNSLFALFVPFCGQDLSYPAQWVMYRQYMTAQCIRTIPDPCP
jgi:hypothetical protein